MRILVIDVGCTHVKVLATGHKQRVEFPSGPKMTPAVMLATVRAATTGWKYDAVSVGYPGAVVHGRPIIEPRHLGSGWVGFDFKKAFGRPVKIVNDAAILQPDKIYIGGGNSRNIIFKSGSHVQRISNLGGILGGFMVWEISSRTPKKPITSDSGAMP